MYNAVVHVRPHLCSEFLAIARTPRSRSLPQSGHTGIVFSQGICLLRIGLNSKASPLEQCSDAPINEGGQVEGVLVLRRRQRIKPRAAIVTGRINPVEHDTVEVDIGIQGVPKALDVTSRRHTRRSEDPAISEPAAAIFQTKHV